MKCTSLLPLNPTHKFSLDYFSMMSLDSYVQTVAPGHINDFLVFSFMPKPLSHLVKNRRRVLKKNQTYAGGQESCLVPLDVP